jgi:hypothetical protein
MNFYVPYVETDDETTGNDTTSASAKERSPRPVQLWKWKQRTSGRSGRP